MRGGAPRGFPISVHLWSVTESKGLFHLIYFIIFVSVSVCFGGWVGFVYSRGEGRNWLRRTCVWVLK